MSDLVQFGTVGEATETYYGVLEDADDDPEDDDAPTSESGWGEMKKDRELGYAWLLTYQNNENAEGRRWFVNGGPESTRANYYYLDSSGEPVELTEGMTGSDLPSWTAENEAISAYEAWVAKYGDDYDEDGVNGWSSWMEVDHVPPWYVDARTHTDGERIEFVISGMLEGEPIFLGADGYPREDPKIYTDADSMNAALDAYFENVENGDIPEDQRPNGDRPPLSVIEDLTEDATDSSKKKLLAVGALALGGVIAHKQGAFEDLQL